MASRPAISPKTLELAANGARAANLADVGGAASAAAAFRESQAMSAVDLSGVTAAMQDLQKMGHFKAISESISLMGQRNTEALSQALTEINAKNAAAVLEAFKAADLGAKWRAQVAETMKVLNLSQAMRSQIAESMHEIAKIPPAALAPRFVAALAEAETYADLPEVQAVANATDFERLTLSEKRALQAAVLVAVSEIGTLVAALHARDPTSAGSALLALLATLLVIHQVLAV